MSYMKYNPANGVATASKGQKIQLATTLLSTALKTIHETSLRDIRAGSLRSWFDATRELEDAERLLKDALA
jgi:hypothetical protein